MTGRVWVRVATQRTATVWGISTEDVVAASGVDYRRIHYWVRQDVFGKVTKTGPGYRLRWDPDVVPLVRLLGRIADAFARPKGLSTDRLRQIVVAHESGWSAIMVAPGVALAWDPL